MSEYIFLKQKKKTMFYLQRHRISLCYLSPSVDTVNVCMHATYVMFVFHLFFYSFGSWFYGRRVTKWQMKDSVQQTQPNAFPFNSDWELFFTSGFFSFSLNGNIFSTISTPSEFSLHISSHLKKILIFSSYLCYYSVLGELFVYRNLPKRLICAALCAIEHCCLPCPGLY